MPRLVQITSYLTSATGTDQLCRYAVAIEIMRELLTVKANVDRLLGQEAQEQEAEATRKEEQR